MNDYYFKKGRKLSTLAVSTGAVIFVQCWGYYSRYKVWKAGTESSYPLLSVMKNINPLIEPKYPKEYFDDDGDKTLIEAYVVKGTSIVFGPWEGIDANSPLENKKYEFAVIDWDNDGSTDIIDGKEIDVTYILENYPDRVTKDFIFNIELFR